MTPKPDATPRYTEEEWRDLMGDDGTGHCRGCGGKLEVINPACEVCVQALCAFMDDDVDSDGRPFDAAA